MERKYSEGCFVARVFELPQRREALENLLATPVRPLEVMVGRIGPYVPIGYVQLGVIVAASWLLFQVPMVGRTTMLMAAIGAFLLANLGVALALARYRQTVD